MNEQNVFIVVVLLSAVYVVAHTVADRLQRLFLLTTGAEYIAVGAILGVTGVLDEQRVSELSPVISLAIGWLGLSYGMQANARELLDNKEGLVRITTAEAVLTAGIVGMGAWWLFRTDLMGTWSDDEAAIAAWVLAASAAVGSTSVIDLVRRGLNAQGQHTDLLERSARLGELVSIAAFGFVFCYFHVATEAPLQGDSARLITSWEWLLITVATGFILGLLCQIFLGGEPDMDRLFLALLGTIVFASGVAYFLELSTLLVNLVLGTYLANALPTDRKTRQDVRITLDRAQRPMVIILLVFAGAMWTPVDPGRLAILAAGYILIRAVSKIFGAAVGTINLDGGVRRDVGRGMLGHGEVAVAMAVSAVLVFRDSALMDLVYATILVSALTMDVVSPRLVKNLLIDSGDIEGGQQLLPRRPA